MQAFNVIWWDFNKKEPEAYDIMPFLVNSYFDKSRKERPKISDKTAIKDFIKRMSLWMWWGRTEYEIILSDWPCNRYNEKIDIYYQIMMNLDIIVDIFIYNVKLKRRGEK